MRETTEIAEFKAHLARIDGPTLGLLDSFFRSRSLAWQKIYQLCSFAVPAEGELVPAWSRWYEKVAQSKQATFARELAALLHAEVERRSEAKREAELSRRNSLTQEDVKLLTDAELSLVGTILGATLETAESRWALLSGFSELRSPALRSSTWRKWRRIASGPEAIRSAAVDLIVSESHRRGLDGSSELDTTPEKTSHSRPSTGANQRDSTKNRTRPGVAHRPKETSPKSPS